MRRNSNIFKSNISMSQTLADWLDNQAAVGGTVTSIDSDSFEFKLAGQLILVTHDKDTNNSMTVYIEDQDIFENIHSNLEVDQTLRTGSGQWTFYSEPEEQRIIISERLITEQEVIN